MMKGPSTTVTPATTLRMPCSQDGNDLTSMTGNSTDQKPRRNSAFATRKPRLPHNQIRQTNGKTDLNGTKTRANTVPIAAPTVNIANAAATRKYGMRSRAAYRG